MQVSASSSSSTQQALLLAAEQLASGKRITSAAVDPSGLAIENALTSQASGDTQGASNAQSAIDASNVAQGALVTISNAAQQLHTLSVAANNDFLSAGDRADLQTQANQTTQEINSVASTTSFNGFPLLNGSTPSATVQTGSSEGSTSTLSLPSSGTSALGLSTIDLSSSASAAASESSAAAAGATLAKNQAALGAQTVALGFDQQNSALAATNLTASASSIGDADVTQAATGYANQQVLSHIQIALQVQSNLAVSSLVGLSTR